MPQCSAMATATTEAHTYVAPLMPHSHGVSAGARPVTLTAKGIRY